MHISRSCWSLWLPRACLFTICAAMEQTKSRLQLLCVAAALPVAFCVLNVANMIIVRLTPHPVDAQLNAIFGRTSTEFYGWTRAHAMICQSLGRGLWEHGIVLRCVGDRRRTPILSPSLGHHRDGGGSRMPSAGPGGRLGFPSQSIRTAKLYALVACDVGASHRNLPAAPLPGSRGAVGDADCRVHRGNRGTLHRGSRRCPAVHGGCHRV
jgi:hypothetical protein